MASGGGRGDDDDDWEDASDIFEVRSEAGSSDTMSPDEQGVDTSKSSQLTVIAPPEDDRRERTPSRMMNRRKGRESERRPALRITGSQVSDSSVGISFSATDDPSKSQRFELVSSRVPSRNFIAQTDQPKVAIRNIEIYDETSAFRRQRALH